MIHKIYKKIDFLKKTFIDIFFEISKKSFNFTDKTWCYVVIIGYQIFDNVFLIKPRYFEIFQYSVECIFKIL